MKKIIPIFTAQIENGVLRLDDIGKYKNYLNTLKGEIELTIRERRKVRGLNQNALYWVYLNLIAEETANDTTEDYIKTLHDAFKEEFIQSEAIELFGKKRKKYKTTTKMSPMEFSNYIKQIEVLTGILCPEKDNIEYEVK